jgi:hypothetical protein
MPKHAVTAVGALTMLALATTPGAASGLPTGKRQHKPSRSPCQPTRAQRRAD